MGQEYDPQVIATMGLAGDSSLQRYVRDLGTRLAAQSERPGLPWTFRVVNDPVVNAFALPGGFIYVTRGILAHFNSEAELVAVLGHEIGHVTARHSVEQMSRQQLAGLGLAVGSILSPEIARFGNVASAALGVLFLKFGRDDERQSDDLGLRYMRRLNYDVREMPDVFTTLERVGQAAQAQAGGGGGPPEWLSTHPSPENRREHILQEISELPPDSLGRLVNRNEYLRMIDGIVFGENPREGYFKGSDFLHPDLRFRVRFPEGWKTANQQQAVLGVSSGGDAMIQISLAQATSADAAGRAFFTQQGIAAANPSRTRVNGLSAVGGQFAAETQSGPLRGLAVFIEYGGQVYQLLGYTPAVRWSGYASIIERSLLSFEELRDRAVLNAQPWRLDIISVPRAMTLTALAAERPAPVPVATLALVNQLDANASLAAGQRLKWVVGRPLP
jgi:predicted Zn-dependent protease